MLSPDTITGNPDVADIRELAESWSRIAEVKEQMERDGLLINAPGAFVADPRELADSLTKHSQIENFDSNYPKKRSAHKFFAQPALPHPGLQFLADTSKYRLNPQTQAVEITDHVTRNFHTNLEQNNPAGRQKLMKHLEMKLAQEAYQRSIAAEEARIAHNLNVRGIYEKQREDLITKGSASNLLVDDPTGTLTELDKVDHILAVLDAFKDMRNGSAPENLAKQFENTIPQGTEIAIVTGHHGKVVNPSTPAPHGDGDSLSPYFIGKSDQFEVTKWGLACRILKPSKDGSDTEVPYWVFVDHPSQIKVLTPIQKPGQPELAYDGVVVEIGSEVLEP